MGIKQISLVVLILSTASCAQISARQKDQDTRTVYTRPTGLKRTSSSLNLDEKAKTKVNDAFQAVILNDDKKAKTSYGRGYKYMPEFVQFAFDLRFKNYDHALELLPKLPYSDEEKQFWKKVLEQKPRSIQKAVCDELTAKNYAYSLSEPLKEEISWYADIQEVIDGLYQNQKPIQTKQDVQDVLSKVPFKDEKGNLVGLNETAQKQVLNDVFFDQFRNTQRRDTNAWMAHYQTPVKAWNYQRGFNPTLAYDFYSSLQITDSPRKKHFNHRLKGIIKDMRVESLTLRSLGDKSISDEVDLKKIDGLLNFKSRYPVVSTFLHLDTTLANCGLINVKEN